MNRFISLLFMSVLFTGCASPTNPIAMAPVDYKPAKIQPYAVSVATNGGQETSSGGKSQVSNQDLQKAIEETILRTKAFKQLVKGNDADYELSATVVTLNQPSIGFSFTVKVDIAWSLKKMNDDSPVWRRLIKSEHTATTGDAFAGVVRLQMATEGAVKKNIELALEEIAQLNL